MRVDFRIDFGYQYLYSRRHYHPVFVWDGELVCTGGEILETYRLEYPYTWFGPVMSARETPLTAPAWQMKTKRGITGLRFVAEVEEEGSFLLSCASCELSFSVRELCAQGRLDFPVGPKYLGCSVTVTLRDHLWFCAPPEEGETVFSREMLGAPLQEHGRMTLAWIAPGEAASWDYEVQESDADVTETLFHIVAMGGHRDAEGERQVHAHFPLELLCDGKSILRYERYYREHDIYVQLLEDDFKRVHVPPGRHTFSLRNHHPEYALGISRIVMREFAYRHGELSLPVWCMAGETVIGKLFSREAGVLAVYAEGKETVVECVPGWNEFTVSLFVGGVCEVRTDTAVCKIEVLDVEEEDIPVKVGYDMTSVPHDRNGFMDYVLDYTYYKRLGNYVVFRSFLDRPPRGEDMLAFGGFCRRHGIYASACLDFDDGCLIRGAGEMFHDCGRHEYPGAVYAFDPTPPYASRDMKEASEKYMEYLKIELDRAHRVHHRAAFGDASGGIRYSYLAGADFVRAETMVGNTMLLLPMARPAAEALGDGNWGVHIAIQHGYQPYHETHLGQYFLSLFQPWMMGAKVIYEEDSLFSLWKEERQAWDDLLVRGKREMTESFFKFAKTHPRRGRCVRRIAYIEGRYAAPFNGFICDTEQDPHYAVWGRFGCDAPEWGHCQPEKGRAVLDVLAPGMSILPLRQRYDRRRFFFAGTPYGDFDCVPIEAGGGYLSQYSLLLHLGWNTMIEEDYAKLLDYVRGGGMLFLSLPQFSTHVGREFLAEMKELALYREGELSELCGFRVLGRGAAYSGQWSARERERMAEPTLSAIPSDSPDEDGEAYLAEIEPAGCEVMAWDSASGAPLLVRHRVGEGFVYTMTVFAYPGHERLQRFSAAWVARLAEESRGDVFLRDPSGEVFYTVWRDGETLTVMLLNTDWTVRGNVKEVMLVSGTAEYPLLCEERTALIVTLKEGKMTQETHRLS